MGSYHVGWMGVIMGKKSIKKSRVFLRQKSISVIAGLSVSLLTFSSVEALNIGQARSQSYLGQPLSIFVPISDSAQIVDLNQLIVTKPTEQQFKELNVSPVDDLQYQVISKGTEKGILITSQSAANEPYIDLGVNVNYQGASQLSKVTALIDLEPSITSLPDNAVGTALVADNETLVSANSIANESVIAINNVSQNNSSSVNYSNEIMGPYDWAQKNLIPAKFGPVLEGQSLWRVARRINESMGVSIDQMMWALYRANPTAFSGSDVSTLQSGSILVIPEESFVREVTELGAVRLLNPQLNSQVVESLSDTGSPVMLDTQPVELTESDITETIVADSVGSNEPVVNNQIVNLDNGQVGINAELGTDPVNVQAALEPIQSVVQSDDSVAEVQSQGVISLSKQGEVADLKNEVAYLSQQVVAQEERIKLLEERLSIAESQGSLGSVNNAVLVKPANQNDIAQDSPVALESSSEVGQTSEVAATASNSSTKIWSLSALALFLLGLGYVARHRLLPLVLRLFGDRYEYDEEASFLDSVSKKRKVRRDLGNVQAVSPSSGDVLKPQKEEIDDFEDYSFFVDDEELMDVEELSFPDRIKQLIDSGDFDEAKQTVNFASEANVNEHDINVYLLKIFAAESDRESFDKLFDKIHANIDEYDAEAQLMVAELQSEMAIGKVINFNSEKMVG